MSEPAIATQAVDLTNCDREPIHLLGRIQRIGFLISATPDWLIAEVSENVSDFIDKTPEELIGNPVERILDPKDIHTLRNRLQKLSPGMHPDTVAGLKVAGSNGDGRFDVSIHIVAHKIMLEFEPHQKDPGADRYVNDVQQAVNRIGNMESLDAMLRFATRFVSAISGFDRVMLYRFQADQSGEVVAETLSTGMEPYLGLRYPASDIPSQARQLYTLNPVRTIASVIDEGARILSHDRSGKQALDLSFSVLRSVSPIHLEYLRNMGVGASFSISLVVEGKLWGLIACHHNEGKYLPQAQRNSLVLFGQMLSLLIGARINAENRQFQADAERSIGRFSMAAASSGNISEVITVHADLLTEMMSADGLAVIVDGRQQSTGSVPPPDAIKTIAERLNKEPPGEVFVTSELSAWKKTAREYAKDAAGMIAIPVSKAPGDYVLFFRKEEKQSVKWAGNPEKPVELGPNGIRLTPRKSFEAWSTLVENQSRPWSSAEVAVAEQFRVTVLEVVLRMVEEAAQQRRKAAEKQELLIAELNHRVRNILGLVRSLISQTSIKQHKVADFAKVLESRIQSLARAHDQITQLNWSPASLSTLIRTEAGAYLLDKSSRLRLQGEDVMLVPAAYSTMALVIHEMMTNSAKYGALSDNGGFVDLSLSLRPDGSLDIGWVEKKGPLVSKPERRGFGSTIIERSIPFELRGTAVIDYPETGVEAAFWIPAGHIRRMMKAPGVIASADTAANGDNGVAKPANDEPFPERVLIVEDNVIIAIDVESVLHDLGAKAVHISGEVSKALDIVQDERIDFALLDINLGPENSFPIAEQLRARDIPFVFASGYGDFVPGGEEFKDVKVVSKPYDKETLRRSIASAMNSGLSK